MAANLFWVDQREGARPGREMRTCARNFSVSPVPRAERVAFTNGVG